MADIEKILLPDIGDFESVEVIDVLIKIGDKVEPEDSLITLESDKAAIDIPCPAGGIVKEIPVSIGDRVSQGDWILSLETKADIPAPAASVNDTAGEEADTVEVSQPVAETNTKHGDIHCEVLVLGGGPGGYAAASRAADLGKKTVLVERYPALGGVCLNVGCIPSKAMLHIAGLISEIDELKQQGLDLGVSNVDTKSVRTYAVNIINKLTAGLKMMAKQRRVQIVQGCGRFTAPHMLQVEGREDKGATNISFEHAIIAAGSQPANIPGLPDDPRIMDSTGALLLHKPPKTLLVIGGGIIGLEMATIYAALGAKITIVEMLDSLIAGCDKDIIKPLQKHINKRYENIYFNTAVKKIKAQKRHLLVSFDGPKAPASAKFDAVLVAVGRRPNGLKIGADKAGVEVGEQGFIAVDNQQRTNCPHIFAVGDIVGQPMLAHKAAHEGKIAAEVIAGLKHGFDDRVIPAVAYTDPEVAWVGLTETEARARGIDYGKGVFPWAASGRALSVGRNEGLSKLIFDKESNRILGAAIVGPNAGELIAECVLAIEMGADAEDIGLTIHPHPTLSETVGMAAEVFTKTVTDIYLRK